MTKIELDSDGMEPIEIIRDEEAGTITYVYENYQVVEDISYEFEG